MKIFYGGEKRDGRHRSIRWSNQDNYRHLFLMSGAQSYASFHKNNYRLGLSTHQLWVVYPFNRRCSMLGHMAVRGPSLIFITYFSFSPLLVSTHPLFYCPVFFTSNSRFLKLFIGFLKIILLSSLSVFVSLGIYN